MPCFKICGSGIAVGRNSQCVFLNGLRGCTAILLDRNRFKAFPCRRILKDPPWLPPNNAVNESYIKLLFYRRLYEYIIEGIFEYLFIQYSNNHQEQQAPRTTNTKSNTTLLQRQNAIRRYLSGCYSPSDSILCSCNERHSPEWLSTDRIAMVWCYRGRWSSIAFQWYH